MCGEPTCSLVPSQAWGQVEGNRRCFHIWGGVAGSSAIRRQEAQDPGQHCEGEQSTPVRRGWQTKGEMLRERLKANAFLSQAVWPLGCCLLGCYAMSLWFAFFHFFPPSMRWLLHKGMCAVFRLFPIAGSVF